MFTKRAFLAIVLIAFMATVSYGQGWLYNDNGSATSYWGDPSNNAQMATTLTAGMDSFLVDSVIVCLYAYAGAGPLSFNVVFYDPDANIHSTNCPSGGVDCDGPGSVIATVGPFSSGGTYPNWKGCSIPDVDCPSPFIVAIEMISGWNQVSTLMDGGSPPCCQQYMYNPSPWREHYDYWSAGNYMIRAHGTPHGEALPPTLRVVPPEIFYGHASIPWTGTPEAITQEDVILMNIGGDNDTITAITSTNPDFYWTGITLPYILGPSETALIDVTFQTSTEGDRVGTLDITHTGENDESTLFQVALSGIGFNGHWLENFYEGTAWDPVCGPWYVQRDSSLDDQTWSIFSGSYSDQSSMAGHQYTLPDSFVIDWLASSNFVNPDNMGCKVTWMTENRYASYYYYHGFYWTSPDCTYYYFIDSPPPTAEGDWVEDGPYFINDCATDCLGIAFMYAGNDGDSWFIDDIRVDSLPQLPPVITHEHHTDVTDNFVHITARVSDPNADAMNVLLYYKGEQDVSWSSVTMTAVVGCDVYNLYEATITDLVSCCRYDYYFAASDPAGSGLTTLLPVTAPTDYFTVDIMSAPSEITYDNGEDFYVTLFYAWWGRWAVRFTPPSYPYYLGGAHFKAPNDWPDDDHQNFVFEVYDDNGTDNLPGTLLYGPDETGVCWNLGVDACDDTSFNSWYYVKFCPCIEITEGDFYIAMRNQDNSEYPAMEGVAYDNDGPSGTAYPDYRTYIFYADETPGSGFWGIDTLDFTETDPHSDLILRAVECGLVDPGDLTIVENAGNKELYWDTSVACCFDVYRAENMDDPAWPGDFTLIASCVKDYPYVDASTADKAMYVVAGACDPTVPPSMAMPPVVGPVSYSDYYKTASHKTGDPWSVLTKGAMPKKISKEELKDGIKFNSSKTSWGTAK
jgi:hypothetical protein